MQMRWALDPQGAALYLSPEWLQYTGLREPETIGTLPSPAVHPDDSAMVKSLIRASTEVAEPFLVTFRIRRFDQVYSWVMAGGSPSFGPADGTFLGYLGDTEPLALAPDPPRVMSVLDNVPQTSRHRVMLLDAMADHLISARNIAKNVDDASVTATLDRALLSIGELIYKSVR